MKWTRACSLYRTPLDYNKEGMKYLVSVCIYARKRKGHARGKRQMPLGALICWIERKEEEGRTDEC